MTDIRYTIGASDVGAILGLSPWQTPVQAWARLSGLSPTDAGNNATRRGHLIERALLMDVADTLGVAFWRYGDAEGPTVRHVAEGAPWSADRANSWRHPDEPWMACRPDALMRCGELVELLIEAKTTRTWQAWDGPDGQPILPPSYFAQVVWQMHVTGVRLTRVEAFCTMTDERRTYHVAWSDGICHRIVSKVRAWRERYLLGDEMPENIPADIAGLIWPAEREPETWLDATDEARNLVHQYMHHHEAEKAAKAAKEAARDKLCMMIQDAAGIDGLCSWRAGKRGRTFRVTMKGDEE